MHHLTCGISSLLHYVNLIVFTFLLVHLILPISPHHSHYLRWHHLPLSQSFTITPDLKLISFTSLFLRSLSRSFSTAFTDLDFYRTILFLFLARCGPTRLSWSHVAFESTLNSSYRIVSYIDIAAQYTVTSLIFLLTTALISPKRGKIGPR